MTSAAPIEVLLHQVLDRLTRQERRSENIEATLSRLTASAGSARITSGSPVPSCSSSETPPEILWPRREALEPTKSVDRLKELEKRLSEAEERLRMAARLEIVGRLVTGVAHDFNNLLTIISGHADVIRCELEAAHPLQETADVIATTAQTAAG